MKVRDKIREILLKLLYIYPYRITTSSDLSYIRAGGAIIGNNFSMQQGCIIDDSHAYLITIGDDVTLAPNVHILAHDASTKRALGYTVIAPVTIGNNVFVGAGSIILPGVTIGDNVIIGAGTVVTKGIPSDVVYCGNRVIKSYEQFVREKTALLDEAKSENRVYDSSYTIKNGVSNEKKQEMKKKNGGFIE